MQMSGSVCFVTCDVDDEVTFLEGEGGFDDCWCWTVAAAFPGVGVDGLVAGGELKDFVDDVGQLRDSAADWWEDFVAHWAKGGGKYGSGGMYSLVIWVGELRRGARWVRRRWLSLFPALPPS
jgi:hypothetical protein